MRFLLSGEGASDIGVCSDGNDICGLPAFLPGPMSVIVNQVVEKRQAYSPLDAGVCHCVPEHTLAERASELKVAKKSLGLPGKKRAKETRYFFNNARVLARIAQAEENEREDDVVA